MSYEEELKNNFRNLKLEVLQDIVKNKKDEYTEEAYKIAINELKKQTSEDFVNKLLNESINTDISLNIVNQSPDDSWAAITYSRINNNRIVEKEKIDEHINLFKKYNIPYISYLEEYVSGGKHPKYNNSLNIYVKTIDLDYVTELLFKNNILLDKTIDEIEEFQGVDMEKTVQEELEEFNMINSQDNISSTEKPNFESNIYSSFITFSILLILFLFFILYFIKQLI